jgi:pimeloyl-ACP methyl ester carboxylesterase
MPLVDPLLSEDQARQVSKFTYDIYREMEGDEEFCELGSAMQYAYSEVLGREFNLGHYYLYAPQDTIMEPRPAIVFLHGSEGNFKAYAWVWSKFAKEKGCVIIFPSYGFGNWDGDGIEHVMNSLADAKTRVAINQDKIYLAGLSNGGKGVSLLAEKYSDLFKGLIFISPVLIKDKFSGSTFERNWSEKRIFMCSGTEDKRIPLSSIENAVEDMESANAKVTFHTYPDEDHFLFFSQPEQIFSNISIWLSDDENQG